MRLSSRVASMKVAIEDQRKNAELLEGDFWPEDDCAKYANNVQRCLKEAQGYLESIGKELKG